MRHLSALAISVTLVACASISAAAAPTGLDALRQLPPDVLSAGIPGTAGIVGGLGAENEHGWENIGSQHWAMEPIQLGALRGDAAMVDRYWPALDTAFAHQQPDGSFDYSSDVKGVPQGPAGQATGAAFFLSDAAEALLTLRSSSLAKRYAVAIDALLPKFRLSLNWLAQPAQIADMAHRDTFATNRLLYDARAFLLGDALATDALAHAAGVQFLDHALAVQNAAGYFPERGGSGAYGPDTSYNAVSCMNLTEIGMFVDDPRIKPAVVACANWELTRIHDDGEVDTAGNTRTGPGFKTATGAPYSINYHQVARAFEMAWALTGDPRYLDAAKRVAAYHRTHH